MDYAFVMDPILQEKKERQRHQERIKELKLKFKLEQIKESRRSEEKGAGRSYSRKYSA